MGSLIEQLKRQEEAARAEAGRLRARIEELQQDLARAEERASRPVSPIGAVTVLPWREGTEASVLPRTYQDLLEVAADAGRPLRAGEFAAASGLSTEKAKVEGLRSKLRLLAARGWLAPAPGGLFTHCQVTQRKHRNPDSNGFFFLSSEVLTPSGPQGRRTLHGSVLPGSRR